MYFFQIRIKIKIKISKLVEYSPEASVLLIRNNKLMQLGGCILCINEKAYVQKNSSMFIIN
jgi:hypothetical protein